ncbi:MAG: hypothetical protein J0I18_18700, partial [Actinobacteria bacterium]|nr:hypothetical protein [Actinomycetota bacterium]
MSPPVRPRGSTGRLVAALISLLLAVAATAATAAPASAASTAAATEATTRTARTDTAPPKSPSLAPGEASSGTPTPTPTPGPPQLDPLPGRLITSLPLTVSGTAEPGEVIDISGGSSTNADSSCTATAGDDGRFRCAIQRLPDGPGVPVRAQSRSTGLTDSGRVDVLSPPVLTSAD